MRIIKTAILVGIVACLVGQGKWTTLQARFANCSVGPIQVDRVDTNANVIAGQGKPTDQWQWRAKFTYSLDPTYCPIAPTGTVTYTIDNQWPVGTNQLANNVGGSAFGYSNRTSNLGEGHHTVEAKYNGDGNYKPASGATSIDVKE